MLRTGDVIRVQYNAPGMGRCHYRILNGSPTGNYRYYWIYFSCQCETLTADITVRPPGDTIQEDEEIKTNGQYRESL